MSKVLITNNSSVSSIKTPGSVTDKDALNFLIAADIEYPYQQKAIKQLVYYLKYYNLWDKIYTLYPFVGGTEDSHKYNLKDPSSFQLTWSGTITHSNTGVNPDGISGRALSGWIMNSEIADTDGFGYLYYARESLPTTTSETLMQGWNSAVNEVWGFNHGATNVSLLLGSQISAPNLSHTTSGLYIGTGKYLSNMRSWYNDNFYQSISLAPLQDLNREIPFFCRQYALGYARYSSVECGMIAFIDYLSEEEGYNLYSTIQRYQTALNRNV